MYRKLVGELDVKVQEFIEKALDSYYPYLFFDASYFKVRDETRYVNKVLLVIIRVRTDGHREVLTAYMADAECELTWEGMFSDLKEQGLAKVDLIVSEDRTGIQSAAGRISPGSSWQMCHVHFIRAVLRKVPQKYQKEIAEALKESFTDSEKILEFAAYLDDRGLPQAADTIHRFHHGLMNYRSFPLGVLEEDPYYQSPGTGQQGTQTTK